MPAPLQGTVHPWQARHRVWRGQGTAKAALRLGLPPQWRFALLWAVSGASRRRLPERQNAGLSSLQVRCQPVPFDRVSSRRERRAPLLTSPTSEIIRGCEDRRIDTKATDLIRAGAAKASRAVAAGNDAGGNTREPLTLVPLWLALAAWMWQTRPAKSRDVNDPLTYAMIYSVQ